MMLLFRRHIALVSIVLFLALLLIPAFILERLSRKEVGGFRTKLRELSVLSAEYRSMKEEVDLVERKPALVQTGGVANALDGISSSLGIKGRIKSVKAVGSREIRGSMSEERAEVQMEKVTLNELVNLLYRIEDAPMILSVKKAAMKKSFENPELLDITMTVALFTKK